MRARQLTDGEKDFLKKMRGVYYVYELADILNCSKQQIYRFFKKECLEFLRQKGRDMNALTLKERDILKYAAFPIKAIATKKMIEPCTVRTYLNNIYQKFNVNNRASAILYALKKGILKLEDFEDGLGLTLKK